MRTVIKGATVEKGTTNPNLVANYFNASVMNVKKLIVIINLVKAQIGVVLFGLFGIHANICYQTA